MAIDPSAKFTNILTPDADYPFGAARNVSSPGDGTGTPLDEAWLNDLWGLLQKLLDASGTTPSGTPDTVQSSQYYQALQALFVRASWLPFVNDVANVTDEELNLLVGLLADADDLNHLQGLLVDADTLNLSAGLTGNIQDQLDAKAQAAFRGALVYYGGLGQSIADTFTTAVAFNYESYDTDEIHDGSTNNTRLTVPAGVTKVRLSGSVAWAGNTTGRRALRMYKNGVGSFAGNPHSTQSGYSVSHGQSVSSGALAVTGGDYFELVVYQDSGAALDVNENVFGLNERDTWFCMEILE